jgi:hypothetical protein
MTIESYLVFLDSRIRFESDVFMNVEMKKGPALAPRFAHDKVVECVVLMKQTGIYELITSYKNMNESDPSIDNFGSKLTLVLMATLEPTFFNLGYPMGPVEGV